MQVNLGPKSAAAELGVLPLLEPMLHELRRRSLGGFGGLGFRVWGLGMWG